MRKLLFLLSIVMYLIPCSHAQESINMIEILNIEKDIISLENRISNLIKKNSAMADMQNLRQFHILMLHLDYNKVEFKKERYLDLSFLYHLEPQYYEVGRKGKEEYLRTMTLITDSAGNLITNCDARFFFRTPPIANPGYVQLAKMLFDEKFDYILWLSGPHEMGYKIGIKGSKLYAIKTVNNELKIYTWEEFMECCFDKWIWW